MIYRFVRVFQKKEIANWFIVFTDKYMDRFLMESMMSSKNLVDLICAYQGSSHVKVQIYFKNGKVGELTQYAIDRDAFVTAQGTKIPFSLISHAEIMAA